MRMIRITILLVSTVFMHFFYPDITLSQPQPAYPTYYQLWLQSVENQTRIQELQRQLDEVRVAIGGLQKDLNSIFDLQQRLEELEKSNQGAIKALSEELPKMRNEIAEIRKLLNPQKE